MAKGNQTRGALSGIRVLDLTRVLAGPFCTMLLGDMGAEIIKIETPGQGDDSRRYPPFIGEESAYFMNLNRNKKSLVLNLKHPKAKEIFLDLVEKADVVLENLRPSKRAIPISCIRAYRDSVMWAPTEIFPVTTSSVKPWAAS